MSVIDFIDKAPCNGADPWLFDQYQLDLAQPGLQYCRKCPFWKDCNDLVQPRESHYDGISAGRVWRNGRVLARLADASPHSLIVAEERDILNVDAVAIRRSELLGD